MKSSEARASLHRQLLGEVISALKSMSSVETLLDLSSDNENGAKVVAEIQEDILTGIDGLKRAVSYLSEPES